MLGEYKFMLFLSVRHKLGTITMLTWISIINIFYTLVSSRILDIYVYIYILHMTLYNYVNEIYNRLYMLKKTRHKRILLHRFCKVTIPPARASKPKIYIPKRPCRRPGCFHKPKPRCCLYLYWRLPCKADCFEV